MKNLYQVEVYNAIRHRIGALSYTSTPVWGKMNVAQMLTHCAKAMEMALGDVIYKQDFKGKLIAPFMKQSYYNDKPFKRNLPTYKPLKVVDERDFEAERGVLVHLIERFHEGGPAACTKGPHPIFGHYTPEQWSSGMYKHLDHHLRQFSV
ncbi:MAG: DUF1569 domain-containing protein [Bacteroidota bacterium]